MNESRGETPSTLTVDELRRYSRQLRVPGWGAEGQIRVAQARVLVIGAGGLGSPVLMYLAGAGVGTLGIVDDDTLDESNLHRQVIHSSDRVGQRKAESARATIRALNADVDVVLHTERLTRHTVDELITGYELVVDGSDNQATRYAVSDATTRQGTPHVWGSVLRGDGMVSVFHATDDQDSRTLRDLFPDEFSDGESCEVAGVVGPLCGVVGSLMATEALKLITGMGSPLMGRVAIVDAFDSTMAVVPFGRRERDSRSAPESSERGISVTESPSVSVQELAEMLKAREAGTTDFVLVDIREPFEREIVAIGGSVFIPMQGLLQDEARAAMPTDATVILHCHHDGRSRYARDVLEQQGWEDVRFLEGGVHAWATEVETDKATY